MKATSENFGNSHIYKPETYKIVFPPNSVKTFGRSININEILNEHENVELSRKHAIFYREGN